MYLARFPNEAVRPERHPENENTHQAEGEKQPKVVRHQGRSRQERIHQVADLFGRCARKERRCTEEKGIGQFSAGASDKTKFLVSFL